MILDPNQLLRMVRGAVLLLLIVLFFFLVLWSLGCTTTETVYERVEVPVPYWDPPENLVPLPQEIDLQISHVTPEEAAADPTSTLVMVGQDFNQCLGDLEGLRHLYAELLKLCSAPPVVAPVPSHPVTPD